MQAAHLSSHRFTYFASREDAGAEPLPRNVRAVSISPGRRRLMQYLLNGVGISGIKRSPESFDTVVGRLMGNAAERATLDLQLWPHAFIPMLSGAAPTAVIVHDLIHLHVPKMFSARELRVRRTAEHGLSRCSLILCPSNSSRADLVEMDPRLADQVEVFPEAPSIVPAAEPSSSALAQVTAAVDGSPYLLHVGFDWPHKNIQVLLAAMRRVAPASFKLVLAGGRRREHLAAAVRAHGLERCVVDMGPVSGELLDALYRGSSALVFPSLYEGFGIPLVEAMHYGLPILGSDRASVPEIIGPAGWILPANSVPAWAEAMEAIAADPASRRELGQRSRLRARAYTWQACWRALDRAFDRVGAPDR